MSKRYVGILVNDSWYRRIPSGNTYHESLDCYEKAGRLHGLTPCFFRLQDIRPGQSHILAYVKDVDRYRKHLLPAPDVIHNRTLYTSKRPKLAIRRLVQDGKRIFNEWNRYGKKQIHDLLVLDPSLWPHLPVTREASPAALKEMMESFDQLILKPNSSSIGKGIMKLERAEQGWLLHGLRRGRNSSGPIAFHSRMPALLRRKLSSRPYLVQQLLPLATYQGKPFDLRVSVQRDASGCWQISGIVGKAAKRHPFLTNLAQGSLVLPLEQLLAQYPHLSPAVVRHAVEQFSLRVAHHLSRQLPNLADLGLDVGLSEHGFPFFIECNGRDLRYSFQKGNLRDAFQATYSNPLGYARYLLETGAATVHGTE